MNTIQLNICINLFTNRETKGQMFDGGQLGIMETILVLFRMIALFALGA